MVGDIEANVEKLRAQLRHLSYPVQHLDTHGLFRGNPTVILPILHFLFLSYSSRVARFLSDKGLELRAKTDLRFLEGAYRAVREYGEYKPALTVGQFLSPGFAERKIMFCQDVIEIVKRWHSELNSEAIAAHLRRRVAQDPAQRALSSSVLKQYLLAVPLPTEQADEGWQGDDSLDTTSEEEGEGPQPPPQPEPLEDDAPAAALPVRQFSTFSILTKPLAEEEEEEDEPPPPQDHTSSTEEVLRFSREVLGEVKSLHALVMSVRADVESRLEKLERQAEERWSQYGHVIGEVKSVSSRMDAIQSAVDRCAAVMPEMLKDMLLRVDATSSHCSSQGRSGLAAAAAGLHEFDESKLREAFLPKVDAWANPLDSHWNIPQPQAITAAAEAVIKAPTAPFSVSPEWCNLPQGLRLAAESKDTARPMQVLGAKHVDTLPACSQPEIKVSAPPEKGTQEMLHQLSAQFKDTQQLLDQARQQITSLSRNETLDCASHQAARH
mmetsp:Transcript_36445/g.66765  ORF Transcript_36445/g.66765 Transcript_36445/m.66765 type:complete len:495 (-) Transcript_36445:108-1592(-)